MDFDLLCQDAIRKINKGNEALSCIKSNPESILTTLFDEAWFSKDTTKVINIFNTDFTLGDFQMYLYDLLIPFLESKFEDSFTFEFTKHYYPSNLKITYEGFHLASVDIYNKTITMLNPIGIRQIEDYINLIEDMLKKDDMIDKSHWHNIIENEKEKLSKHKQYEYIVYEKMNMLKVFFSGYDFKKLL